MPNFRQLPCRAVVVALVVTIAGGLTASATQGVAWGAPAAGPGGMARVTWSGKKGPIPRALTGKTPAQTSVAFPGSGQNPDPLLFWASSASGSISYEHATSLDHDRWSPPKAVDHGKAVTDRGPSAASFTSGSAHDVIVAWKGSGSSGRVWYSIGIAEQGGTLLWGPAFAAPGALTSDSPTVFSPLHSQAIFLSWAVAGGSGIDYLVGSATSIGPLKWGRPATVPKARAASSPAITEASSGSAKGRLYVLWRTAAGASGGAGLIDYATTADPLKGVQRWTAPVSLRRGVTTSATPAAQALGHLAAWPLLIVYRHGPKLGYVTMAESGTVSSPQSVPSLVTQQAPSLFGSILAGPVKIRVFYVRVCSGCSRPPR